MADVRRTRKSVPLEARRVIVPLSGPRLNLQPFTFSESQRHALRQILRGLLDDSEFSAFTAEIEYNAAIHTAFRQRPRLSQAVIAQRLSIYKSQMTRAVSVLTRLQSNADFADHLQLFVRQPFTEEEYSQALVRAATTPAKWIRFDAAPDDENLERALAEAKNRATEQARAEGRLPPKRIFVIDLLLDAHKSLAQIEDILNRALVALHSQRRKGGRHRDVWRAGLVLRLADLYQRFTGRLPTATADNDFQRLVETVFDALEWPMPDRRLLLSALKTLRGAGAKT